LECCRSTIGNQRAVGSFDGRLGLASGSLCPSQDERAVSHIKGPLLPPKVPENRWASIVPQAGSQIAQYSFELIVVAWIDREELAARGAIRRFRIPQEKSAQAPDEFEGDTLLEAEIGNRPGDALGLFEHGGDMNFPTLKRQVDKRTVGDPVVELVTPPAWGRLQAYDRKLRIVAANERRVVKVAVPEAEELVTLIHRNRSTPLKWAAWQSPKMVMGGAAF
jgi:hypothetical protein